MSKNESMKALNDAVQELETARETARVKLHLLSMDARNTWDGMEAKFLELKQNVENQGEKVAEASASAARDLARSIRKLVDQV